MELLCRKLLVFLSKTLSALLFVSSSSFFTATSPIDKSSLRDPFEQCRMLKLASRWIPKSLRKVGQVPLENREYFGYEVRDPLFF